VELQSVPVPIHTASTKHGTQHELKLTKSGGAYTRHYGGIGKRWSFERQMTDQSTRRKQNKVLNLSAGKRAEPIVRKLRLVPVP
jgi:hypothetical protein